MNLIALKELAAGSRGTGTQDARRHGHFCQVQCTGNSHPCPMAWEVLAVFPALKRALKRWAICQGSLRDKGRLIGRRVAAPVCKISQHVC